MGKTLARINAALCMLPILSANAIGTEAWHTVPDLDGVQRIDVQCGRNFLDPREIVVRRDIPVEFVVRTTRTLGAQSHAFVAEIPGNAIQHGIGQNPAKVGFRPDIPGRYVIACRRQGGVPEDPSEQRAKQGILHVIQ